jgi:hypothetical protein
VRLLVWGTVLAVTASVELCEWSLHSYIRSPLQRQSRALQPIPKVKCLVAFTHAVQASVHIKRFPHTINRRYATLDFYYFTVTLSQHVSALFGHHEVRFF